MKNYVPYTYLVITPENTYYYGVCYANNKQKVAHPDKFWKSYFTSSKKVKTLIDKYGKDSFQIQIRKTFDCPKKAISWESKVNKRLTTKHPKFLNDSWLDGRIQTGKYNGNYGKKHTQESLDKAVSTRMKNGSYSREGQDFSRCKTEEYKNKCADVMNNLIKTGKYKHKFLVDPSVLELYLGFDFPDNPDEYKTRGTPKSKIVYFIDSVLVGSKYEDEYTGKNFRMAYRRYLMKEIDKDKQ